MQVSLALTVLNEAHSLPRLLASILSQTRAPQEVVVCDGGSGDGTLQTLHAHAGRLPLRIVELPGCNISAGRNAAIAAASGEIIAVTDAGVELAADWLEQLLAPFDAADAAHGPALVGGFYQSDAHTAFEVALGATTLPSLQDVAGQRFLPSSRSVAFRKTAWAAVGGYPEWLDYSEDVVFDMAVQRRFGTAAFAAQAVAHFRPRPTLRAFARQYFNYAAGDGHAGLFVHIHFIRYFTYLVALPLGIYAAATVSAWLWLAGAVALLAYLRRPLQRALPLCARATRAVRLQVLLWLPVIRITGDLAKLAGYPAGCWLRITRGRG